MPIWMPCVSAKTTRSLCRSWNWRSDATLNQPFPQFLLAQTGGQFAAVEVTALDRFRAHHQGLHALCLILSQRLKRDRRPRTDAVPQQQTDAVHGNVAHGGDPDGAA